MGFKVFLILQKNNKSENGYIVQSSSISIQDYLDSNSNIV